MPDRRKLTSPDNGRLSKGPKTQAGKARSRHNAIRHGILAKSAVLLGEKKKLFQESIRSYYDRFQPQDDLEESLIDELASSYWRIQRLLAIEASMMNREIERQTSGVPVDCLADAFGNLADTNRYRLLQRYDAHLHRCFQRALHNLIDLKKLDAGMERSTATPQPLAPEPDVEPQPVPGSHDSHPWDGLKAA